MGKMPISGPEDRRDARPHGRAVWATSEESRTSLSTSCELTFESKEQRVARDFTMEDKWGQSESSHMWLPAYMVLISLWC